MYQVFYGLREKPFHVTADPAFLYPSRHHQEALNQLRYGIGERLGFLMITGEVGTGKTTLAKALVNELASPTKTALILNPNFSGGQLLKVILQDFGLELRGSTRGEMIQILEQFLLSQASQGGVAVVIVDEAQALSSSALEQVRLLSNVETPKAKLLQIVLVGQPELEDRLATDRRLRALGQRIAVRCQIHPLAEDEVASYIEHRLRVAGGQGFPQFTAGAIHLIAHTSQGIPRRINLLCDRALLAGFVRESHSIDESMIEDSIPEESVSISTV